MNAIDDVSPAEAAMILGCSASTVFRLMDDGTIPRALTLSRSLVEQVATGIYPWRMHQHDLSSYWLTPGAAAALMHVSRFRLIQLGDRGQVPYVRHEDGTRLYRRAQLEPLSLS